MRRGKERAREREEETEKHETRQSKSTRKRREARRQRGRRRQKAKTSDTPLRPNSPQRFEEAKRAARFSCLTSHATRGHRGHEWCVRAMFWAMRRWNSAHWKRMGTSDSEGSRRRPAFRLSGFGEMCDRAFKDTSMSMQGLSCHLHHCNRLQSSPNQATECTLQGKTRRTSGCDRARCKKARENVSSALRAYTQI